MRCDLTLDFRPSAFPALPGFVMGKNGVNGLHLRDWIVYVLFNHCRFWFFSFFFLFLFPTSKVQSINSLRKGEIEPKYPSRVMSEKYPHTNVLKGEKGFYLRFFYNDKPLFQFSNGIK
jgi:hypothetical protein